MEILIYLVPAVLGITLWLGISMLLETALSKKTDEVSRIKQVSRKLYSNKYHNTRYRNGTESTISFWEKTVIDSKLEERMRQSIRRGVKSNRNE